MSLGKKTKKIVVPLLSAMLGGLIVFAGMKFMPKFTSRHPDEIDSIQSKEQVYDDIFEKQEGIREHFDRLFEDGFRAGSDPFEEMRKMREQMEEYMKNLHKDDRLLSNPFDSWYSEKFGGGSLNDISKREDDGFVYYDIKIEDLNSTSITTKIENGYITITGATSKESDLNNQDDTSSSQSVFKSSFSRTFPLPQDIDKNAMQMLTEKNKVILKFPKMKSDV